MGLSIHYKGVLKSPDLIRPLIEESVDICEVMGWRYNLAADDLLEGISITPEKCETLTLTFLPDGKLASRAFILLNMPADAAIFTKTQYAGMDTHMAIIHLLRYLSGKYFRAFELMDEGNFWETNDVEVLRSQFSCYEVALNAVSNALKDFPSADGETPDSLVARLEAYLKQRLTR